MSQLSLTLNQQLDLKNIEYQVKHMSRDQLEDYALDIIEKFMHYQNAANHILKQQLIGSLGIEE